MNIAIIAINDGFLGYIPTELTNHGHELKFFEYTSDESIDFKNLCDLLEWSNVAFFDFVQFPFPKATKLDLGCKIVGRMMGIEAYDTKNIRWENVDHLIMAPPELERLKFFNKVPPIPITILPVGTDIHTFIPKEPRVPSKNLCMVNFLFPRKRIITTIETVAPFLRNGWTLNIQASLSPAWRKDIAQEYAIFINEIIHVLDLPNDSLNATTFFPKPQYVEWLQNQDIIINNSVQEGYAKSVIDACACCVFPLVYNWMGAKQTYNPEFIFHDQCELRDKIEEWGSHTTEDKIKLSCEARKFAELHDDRKVAKEIRMIIESV